MKTRSVLLLMAAFIGLALSPAAAADDPVVARVNGVDIKQSDLDFAATELGPRLANFSAADRQKVLLQYVIESELIAGAGQTDNLDKAESFPDRLKYHERRALRDAYFDVKIYDAVTEAEAKKIYDEKIGQVKPEQEMHARHILVETEAEAKDVAERLKKGEDFATLAKEKSKDPGAEGGDLGFFSRGQMAEAVRGGCVRARRGRNLRPGPDSVRLAYHQGRGEARPAAADLRSGQGGDHRPARAAQGARGGDRPAQGGEDRGGRSRAEEGDGRGEGDGGGCAQGRRPASAGGQAFQEMRKSNAVTRLIETPWARSRRSRRSTCRICRRSTACGSRPPRPESAIPAAPTSCLLLFDPGTTVAGVLTQSKTASAPVDWCRAHLAHGMARALVVNSGNANAFTGKRGTEAVKLTAEAAAEAADCLEADVYIASTGVIGEPLDARKITGASARLRARRRPTALPRRRAPS